MPRLAAVKRIKPQPDNTIDTILQVGQVVAGKYRVDHLAGKGGMAAVWAGTNERTGKKVALKVILRSMATSDKAQHLFHREALAASRINHPNVVTVFDVIDHEGMTCIVMELLDGEPLGSYIDRKGCLSVSETTALLLPAMRGVAAAHAQDVIHRDLKPQNIFVCIGPDGRALTAKVLDFGISVMMERVIGTSAGQVPGQAMGTPAYMSPEHLSGSARVDERVDVYGFGLLLYEALTGQMPFPGEPGSELSNRVLTEPPAPMTKFRQDLPPGLVRIVEVAIAKDPNHRFSDLNLMIAALEDELLPATPLQHMITPITGVPAQVLRDALAGQSVVQAILRKEPSERYRETKMLYGFSVQKQKGDSRGQAGAIHGDGEKSGTSAPPVGQDTVLVRSRADRMRARVQALAALPAGLYVALRPWLRSAALSRRGRILGSGIAVVMVLAVWMLIRVLGGHPAGMPVSSTPVDHPTREQDQPSRVPSVVRITTPTPVSDSPSTSQGIEARDQWDATERVATVPTRSSSPPAAELGKKEPHRRRGRGPAKTASSSRRDRASAKSEGMRAGKLSADDF
jgi:serine/threonine protein kinase